MVLIRLGTVPALIRAVQLWKEAILVLLVVVAGVRLYRAYRAGTLGRPMALDWVAGAFLLTMLVYLALPSGVLHSPATVLQRLAAFRIVALLPVMYALGRTYRPERGDKAVVAWLLVGAAALVGVFGLVELFFIPTRTWLDWGVNGFSAWLGLKYSGPGGMPENYFQTLATGVYLRRMASFYLSPLGIAYTGLLVFPIAVVLLDQQRRRTRGMTLAIIAVTLLIASILFSVTRLAIVSLVGEIVLLTILIRRPWLYITSPLLIAAAIAIIFIYPQIGPAVDDHLNPVSARSGGVVSSSNPSFMEHMKTVQVDFNVAVRHPLGEGLGSAGTSANRFTSPVDSGPVEAPGPDYAPGESAILTMFVDTGVVGGFLHLAFYVLGLYLSAFALLKARRDSLEQALPMAAFVGGIALFPIMLTNDLWGDLSVTFLFWWAVGACATLAVGHRAAVRDSNLGQQTQAATT
jgi:hypothetical protein